MRGCDPKGVPGVFPSTLALVGFFVISCSLLLSRTTLAKKYNQNESHKCKSYEMAREEITAKCVDYFKLTRRSGQDNYDLNYERSNLVDVTDEQMEDLVEKWRNKTDQGPDCYYSRLVQKAVIDCCGGWEKPLCIKPACDPPCLNGGICSQPGTCSCLPDFAGNTCEDDKKNVNGKRKYCYLNKWCYGAKPNSTRSKRYLDISYYDVMDKKTCCSLKDAGGWGLAGESCESCPNAPLDEDSGDFVPDLPKVVLNKDDMPFRTCIGLGPNYWRSFDGIELLFPGRCAYTLLESESIKITVKMVDCHSFFKCRKRLNVFYEEQLLVVAEGSRIMVGGNFLNVNHAQGFSDPVKGLKIDKRGDYFYLELSFVRLRWDENNAFFLTLEKNGDSDFKVKGLCGDYNGNPYDDMKTPGGLKVSHPLEFGNSWVVLDDLEKCPAAEAYGYPCTSKALENKALDACGKIWQAPFKSCHGVVHPNPYFERCVSDYCMADQYSREGKLTELDRQKELQSVVCQAFGSYSQICALREVPFTWRSAHLCPRKCPYGMMYTECAPKCTKTCQNMYQDTSPLSCSDKECYPGCQCLTGTFFNGSHCVAANRCPCLYRGQKFEQGSSVNIGCNLCHCNYGRWKCTKKMCSKICSVIGYQHFQTFDGNKYDFHGPEGTYTLVEYYGPRTDIKYPTALGSTDTSGLERGDLTISYSVTKCLLMSPEISCTSGFRVELKLGLKTYTVTVNKNFEVLVNGEMLDDPAHKPFNDHSLYVKKITNLFVTVQGYGFRVLYDRHGRIYVRLEPFYAGKVQGLCGNMDGSIQNDYKSRNGIEEDLVNFAMSYCHGSGSTDEAYLAGDPCSSGYGSATVYAERHCVLVGKEEIFGPCLAVLVDWNRYFDICMQDSCASPGSPQPVCTALAALAERCANAGYELEPNWMAHPEVYDICGSIEGYQCPDGQMFSDCAPHRPNCRDVQYPGHVPDDEICIAGCRCSGGPTELQDHQGSCVPSERCSCYEHVSKRVYKAKEVWTQPCGDCVCTNAKWDCSKSNCGKTINCPSNQIFVSNASTCRSTCASLDTPGHCDVNEFRYNGCTCPPGMVLHPDGACVLPSECPCSYSSKLYQASETVTIGCKTFQCKNRRWELKSTANCRAICSAYGDPHYKTFDGKCYSFQGPCEYIMTREKDKGRFKVTLENVPCGSQRVTCTKSVTIELKNTKIKLMKGLEVSINDVPVDSIRQRTFPGGSLMTSGLFVVLSFHLGFDVMWDGGTRVYVSMSDQYRNNVEGLCGNFDENYQNEFIDLKSGQLASTAQSFGFKWSTNLCKDKGLSDHFDPCEAFPERQKWAEPVCRVIKDHEMFEECRKMVTSYNEYYKNCIYDSCGCDHGNNCECTCTAIAAFAQECSFKGIYVNWRSNNLCPKMCDKGHEYKSCGSPCRHTCADYGRVAEDSCDASECVEGCFCPDDFYENEDGVCVPLSECKCSYEGTWLSPGTVIEVDCQACKCLNADLSCSGKHCVNNCTDDQFWCRNTTKCVPMSRKCDGIVDCPGQSDELDCAWKCKPEEFTCVFDGVCVPKSTVCDGRSDCGDDSDERICNQTCPGNFFECQSRRCIPDSMLCDGTEDCGLDDTSDESNCIEVCNQADFFRCDNSKCMPRTVRCDEVDDCGDGSDESECVSLTTVSPEKICPVDMTAIDFVHGEQTFSIRINEEMEGTDALLGSRKQVSLTSPRHDFVVIDKPTPVESFTLRRLALWANGALSCEMKVVDVNGEETKYRRKIIENLVSYEFENGLADVLQILLYFESGYAVNVQNLEMIACIQQVKGTGYGVGPYGRPVTCPDPQPLYFNSDLPSLVTVFKQGSKKPIDAQDSLKFSPVPRWQLEVKPGVNYSYLVEIAKECRGDWQLSSVEMTIEGVRGFQMFVGSRVIKKVVVKGGDLYKFSYETPFYGSHVGFAFTAYKDVFSISGFHLTACCLPPGAAEADYKRMTSARPSRRRTSPYVIGERMEDEYETSLPIGVGLTLGYDEGKPGKPPGPFKPEKRTKPSSRRESITTKKRKGKPGVGVGGEAAEYEPTPSEGRTQHYGPKEWDKWPAWFKTSTESYPDRRGRKPTEKSKWPKEGPYEPEEEYEDDEIYGATKGIKEPLGKEYEKLNKTKKPGKGGYSTSTKWWIPSLHPKIGKYPKEEEESTYDDDYPKRGRGYPEEEKRPSDRGYPGEKEEDEEEEEETEKYPDDVIRHPGKKLYPEEREEEEEEEGEEEEEYPPKRGYPEEPYPEGRGYPEDEYGKPVHPDEYPYPDYAADGRGKPGKRWRKSTPFRKGPKTTTRWQPFTGWGEMDSGDAWWAGIHEPGKFRPFVRTTTTVLRGISREAGEGNFTGLPGEDLKADLKTRTSQAGGEEFFTAHAFSVCLKPYVVDYKCNFKYAANLVSQNNMIIRDLKKSDIFLSKPLWSPPASITGGFIISIVNLETCSDWFVVGIKFSVRGVKRISVLVESVAVIDEVEIKGGEVTRIHKEGLFVGSTVEIIVEERLKRCSVYEVEIVYCCELHTTLPTSATTSTETSSTESTTTATTTAITTTTTASTTAPTTQTTTITTIPTTYTDTTTETTTVATTLPPLPASECKLEAQNVLEWAEELGLPCTFPSSDVTVTTCKGICESSIRGMVSFLNGPKIDPVRSCECCGGNGTYVNITGVACNGFPVGEALTLQVFVYESCSCQQSHCFKDEGLVTTPVPTTPAPLCDPAVPQLYIKPKTKQAYRIVVRLQSGQPITDRNTLDLVSDKKFWSPPAAIQKGFSVRVQINEKCSTQWIVLGVKFQMKGVRSYSVVVDSSKLADYEDAEEGLWKFVKEGEYYGSTVDIIVHKRYKDVYMNCIEIVACCGSTTVGIVTTEVPSYED